MLKSPNKGKDLKIKHPCLQQKDPPRGVLKKIKYAANLQENTHARVWFQ